MLSDLLAALASPTRLATIGILRDEDELSAGSLAARHGLSSANVSQHVLVLRRPACRTGRRGIVQARKIGTHVFCRIDSPGILRALDLLGSCAVARLPNAAGSGAEGLGKRGLSAPASRSDASREWMEVTQ